MPDYTKKELAEALEISEKSVQKYINLGKINEAENGSKNPKQYSVNDEFIEEYRGKEIVQPRANSGKKNKSNSASKSDVISATISELEKERKMLRNLAEDFLKKERRIEAIIDMLKSMDFQS